MKDKEHAILSASSAIRWLTCPPSARAEQEENQTECSVYAQEGTAAHMLAEIKLSYRFGKISVSAYQEKYDVFLKDEIYGVYYNKEFEEYVDEYVEYVIKQTEDIGAYHIFFELQVNYSNFVPQGFGTCDTVIVTENWIHVIDLKFGVGIPVIAKDNPQLKLYGVGALNLFPNTNKVKTTIFQPRLFTCDSDEISKKELLKWAVEYVRPRAELAIKGEGNCVATEDGCRFCKLRGKCKARADMQLEIARQEFSVIDEKANLVQNLSIEKLAYILEIAPMFIDWFKDVQAYALGQLAAGVKIPGFKMVEGRSNRIMTDKTKIKEILLKVGLKENEIMKPSELKGISELESLVGKKLFAQLCKEYLIKPMGKGTLALESDKRPELTTLAIAQNDFKEEE